MKKFLLFLMLCFVFQRAAFSQQPTLWESMPLNFHHNPTHILEDSAHHVAYIYGSFDMVNGDTCNIIRMDNGGFTLMPSVPIPVYNGVSATLHQGKLYFGGDYRIAAWDGTSWDSIPVSGSVFYLYSHNDKLYACGSFDSIAHTYVDNLAFWNDTTWAAVPGLDTFLDIYNSLMYQLVWYKDELYVSGVLNKNGTAQTLTLIRFDGQHWTDVDGQIAGNQSPSIKDMLVWKDTLYVCGTFRESNGGAGNGIAKWDGQNWHSLQEGVFAGDQPIVWDMTVFRDELYISGWFYDINGVSYNVPSKFTGFAKWDGFQWCSLGVIANGPIWNLGQFRDTLYVMGVFDTLNNQLAKYMAKWTGGDYTDSCIRRTTGIAQQPGGLPTTSLNLFPNPVSGLLNVHYRASLDAVISTQITISDLTGRVIWSETVAVFTGENHFRLNVSVLSPGMYFLAISNGNIKRTAKFVKQ